MVTVERVSLTKIIALFVVYLVTHIALGLIVKRIEEGKFTLEDDEETAKVLKFGKLFFKAYPAIYLVCVIVSFYL